MSTPTPEKVRAVHGALMRYRAMAWVTGVVLAVMTIALVWFTVAAVDKADRPLWYSIGWIAHGWLFVVYLLTTVDLVTRTRISALKALLVALAGTVPFASFFAERWVTHDVQRRFPQAESSERSTMTSTTDV